MTSPILVWHRLDLRLEDNPALYHAAATGRPVIPVFIWSPDEEHPWAPGGASRWWLHHSLESFAAAVAGRGTRLLIKQGNILEGLTEISRETGAQALYFNSRSEPHLQKIEKKIFTILSKELEIKTFNGHLLFDPKAVKTQTGKPYQVFTPFWNMIRTLPPPRPVGKISELKPPAKWPRSVALKDLKLLPTLPWAKGFAWEPGEASALKEAKIFFSKHVDQYPHQRDIPSERGTSCLSPHLHFGEISIRQLYIKSLQTKGPGAAAYTRELAWREFAHHLLVHFPETDRAPLQKKFTPFSWRRHTQEVEKWRRGMTGYPIVDAGLRELWTTGWMHNRVRMIVASFLVKDLLHSWLDGAEWFWDTLVDADLANNTLGWQWAGGCGADAAPFFRIFNPILQGQKFDPNGAYTKKWVPELAGLNAKWVHCPWQAPPEELTRAGLKLGTDYPWPMVDHAQARERALSAFKKLKG